MPGFAPFLRASARRKSVKSAQPRLAMLQLRGILLALVAAAAEAAVAQAAAGTAAATELECDVRFTVCPGQLGPLGRALSCIAFAAVTIPVVVFARRTWVVLLALVVATTGAFYQLIVMNIRSDFWSHIVIGTACCRISWYALQSGYVRVPWKIGVIGAGLLTSEFVIIFTKTDAFKVYNQMHQLLNLGQVALFVSFAADDFLENGPLAARCCPGLRARLPMLRRTRFVTDPAVLFMLGLAIIAHQVRPYLRSLRAHAYPISSRFSLLAAPARQAAHRPLLP
jgi:hypothetical protein